MHAELAEFFESTINEYRQSSSSKNHRSGKRGDSAHIPQPSLMEKMEKLTGDYDLQQEYALSSLKEIMYQVQHCNDQFHLDLKRMSRDFTSLQKSLLSHKQSELDVSAQSPRSLQRGSNSSGLISSQDAATIVTRGGANPPYVTDLINMESGI